MRKTCRRLVPHYLTNDQKLARLEVSHDFVGMTDLTSNFLNCIVTEGYDPRTHKKIDGFFVHDNARSYTASIVNQFLAILGVVQIEHPPYAH
ncbi:hypothetical protein TNCV_388601 [Trichonephila clavipes]|nr:hypothetical protein TNCV_388601 [Trichonephila clavipes]